MQLRLIHPGKPSQNTYIEFFNRSLRVECIYQHRFPSLLQARTIIETWCSKYNEEGPKKGLGGLTPAAYARRLNYIDIVHPRLQTAALLKVGERRVPSMTLCFLAVTPTVVRPASRTIMIICSSVIRRVFMGSSSGGSHFPRNQGLGETRQVNGVPPRQLLPLHATL